MCIRDSIRRFHVHPSHCVLQNRCSTCLYRSCFPERRCCPARHSRSTDVYKRQIMAIAKKDMVVNVYLEDWSNGMKDSPEYVFRLMDALEQTTTSWIKPCRTTFTWWNGNVVPDSTFSPGNNFDTNKYYIDFALTRQGKKSNPESVLPSKAVRILTLISIVYDVHN